MLAGATIVPRTAFETQLMETQQVSSGWPTYQYNSQNTGYIQGATVPLETETTSTYRIGKKIFPEAGCVVSNGHLYIGTYGGSLRSYDLAQQEEQWQFKTSEDIYSTPAIAGGSAYIGSGDGSFYSLDTETGEREWRYRNGYPVNNSPTVSESAVYLTVEAGSGNGSVVALGTGTGDELWRFDTNTTMESSPALADGVLYVGDGYYAEASADMSYIRAIQASDGSEIWRAKNPLGEENSYSSFSTPVVSGSTVYVTVGEARGEKGYVLAYDTETGTEQWRYTTENPTNKSPAVGDDTVYVGDWFGRAYALSAEDGSERWVNQLADKYGSLRGAPVVAENGVFFGNHALDKDSGSLIDTIGPGSVLNQSALTGGTLYYPNSGTIHIIGDAATVSETKTTTAEPAESELDSQQSEDEQGTTEAAADDSGGIPVLNRFGDDNESLGLGIGALGLLGGSGYLAYRQSNDDSEDQRGDQQYD